MRWKKRPLPRPKDGERRSRHKFAWKPTEVKGQIIDGKSVVIVVWLEFYQVDEHFFQPMNGEGWWVEDSRNVAVWMY